MRQRRESKIGWARLEWVTHQGQSSHRFDVPSGEHDAFGLPGCSTGAGYQREIIDRIALKGLVVDIGKPTFERSGERHIGVETYELAQLRKMRPYFIDQRRVATVKQQQTTIGRIEDELVFRRLIAWIDGTPHGSCARNAEYIGKSDRIVAG
jgi:hypothetical protein